MISPLLASTTHLRIGGLIPRRCAACWGLSCANRFDLRFDSDAALSLAWVHDDQNRNVGWVYCLALPDNGAGVVSKAVSGRHALTAARVPELIIVPVNQHGIEWVGCSQGKEQSFTWFETTCEALTRAGF